MICCKIIANFSDQNGDFAGLLQGLSKYGSTLYDSSMLFFATDEDNINKNKVKNILKKNKYTESIIYEYGVDNLPQESSYINGWIKDWLVTIQKKMIESSQQENFRILSKKMDDLRDVIKQEEAKLAESKEVQADDGGK